MSRSGLTRLPASKIFCATLEFKVQTVALIRITPEHGAISVAGITRLKAPLEGTDMALPSSKSSDRLTIICMHNPNHALHLHRRGEVAITAKYGHNL